MYSSEGQGTPGASSDGGIGFLSWPGICMTWVGMFRTKALSQLFCLIFLILVCGDALGVPDKKIPFDPRLRQARELLGNSYQRKVTREAEDAVESGVEISDFVLETVRALLPRKDRKSAQRIAYAILNSSEEFSLDPVFLMAVIQNESSFQKSMRGQAGEIGLMQVLPATAKWVATLYHLEYRGERTLLNPEENVWIGAALLDKLRRQFLSEGRLYVSAYNVGPKKLRMLMAMDRNPKAYVLAVMRRYLALYQGYKAKGDLNLASRRAREELMKITQ
jgi:hypothetical protein